MSKIKENYTLVQPLNEVDLNRLMPFDTILIETEHSFYNFTLSDSSLLGILSGGILGEKSVCAMLIAAPIGELGSRFNCSKITTGNRIVFFINSGLELLSATTSVVTKLFCITHQENLAEI